MRHEIKDKPGFAAYILDGIEYNTVEDYILNDWDVKQQVQLFEKLARQFTQVKN